MGLEKIERALEFIRQRGPILPVHLSKELGSNTLLAGAILSQLISERKIRISNAKVGGSPLYYVEGQESKLESMLYPHLNDKDKQTFEILKREGVLHDDNQTPLIRTSLRILKDFAMPLEVRTNDTTRIFWKWYALSNDEAAAKIKVYLGISSDSDKNQEQMRAKPQKFERIAPESSIIKNESISKTSQLQSSSQSAVAEKPTKIVEYAKNKHSLCDDATHDNIRIPETITSAPTNTPTNATTSTSVDTEKIFKTPITKNPLHQKTAPKDLSEDAFAKQILSYLHTKGANVLSSTIIKKNSEANFIIRINTPVGELEYFCKAKKKKRFSDSDISNAYVQGQLKKLPTLFLITGDLTKKAQELMSKELKGITITKIGGEI